MFKKNLLLAACVLSCVQGSASVIVPSEAKGPAVEALYEDAGFKFLYVQGALPETSDSVQIQTNKAGKLEFAKNAGISGIFAKKLSRTVLFKHSQAGQSFVLEFAFAAKTKTIVTIYGAWETVPANVLELVKASVFASGSKRSGLKTAVKILGGSMLLVCLAALIVQGMPQEEREAFVDKAHTSLFGLIFDLKHSLRWVWRTTPQTLEELSKLAAEEPLRR